VVIFNVNMVGEFNVPVKKSIKLEFFQNHGWLGRSSKKSRTWSVYVKSTKERLGKEFCQTPT